MKNRSCKKINLDIINSYTNRQKSNKNKLRINTSYNQNINNNIVDISQSQSMNNNYEKPIQDNNNYTKTYLNEEKTNEIPFLLNRKNFNHLKLENNKSSSNSALNIIKKGGYQNAPKDFLKLAEINNNYNNFNNYNNLNNFNTTRQNEKNNLNLENSIDENENIDYIGFLKKNFETEAKSNNYNLEINNNELIKRCQDLIDDNRLLNSALNERTAKLNKIIQENISLKAKNEEYISKIKKNEQKINFYENQFNLFKNNNENYQKIIKELRIQNEKLNQNLNLIQNNHNNDDIQKKNEENFKNKL